ncbi:MAG: tripartite tricarboxylate transporter permease [Rhodobacteraceae bacterium]|nr:tripartite tricarboxylate transporter permease [Paracoccaceae bacterium]
MIDIFIPLMDGFAAAISIENLLFALVGCIIGTLVGVLPGVGPVAGIAILLPLTFSLTPIGALIMLSAIYYGTMYGGTITSVLMNVPGETASVVTAIEGHEMAKAGRAGAALSISAIGSFIGGTIATIGIVIFSAPLSAFGLHFGPPEFFGLVLLSFTLLVGLTSESVLKGFVAAAFGLALTIPGLDPMTGISRLTFDNVQLLDGFGFVPVLMGLFGISEILMNIEARQAKLMTAPMSTLFPSRDDWAKCFGPIVRGTGLGFVIGVIPGLGSATSAFISYGVEKKMSRTPEKFGHGAIEGVAGPETANNASANAALLPLLTLGIPGSATTALLMGAFLINGIAPGPFLFQDHPDIVWTLIASMVIGNVILLVLNLPLVGLWVKILYIPYPLLMVVILVFTIVGSYSLNGSMFDVWTMLGFGVVGYLMRKADFPMAPIALTLVLGPYFEQSLRQSLVLSRGDFMIFFRSGISTTLVVLAVCTITLLVARGLFLRGSRWKGTDSEL